MPSTKYVPSLPSEGPEFNPWPTYLSFLNQSFAWHMVAAIPSTTVVPRTIDVRQGAGHKNISRDSYSVRIRNVIYCAIPLSDRNQQGASTLPFRLALVPRDDDLEKMMRKMRNVEQQITVRVAGLPMTRRSSEAFELVWSASSLRCAMCPDGQPPGSRMVAHALPCYRHPAAEDTLEFQWVSPT